MQPENPKVEIEGEEITEKATGAANYKTHLVNAVVASQYMMMYASSNIESDIDQDTIEKLIAARHRVEKGEELTTEEEADFWLAYQVLWKLVQPATAESIMANLPIESSSSRGLFGKPIVKSRRTVNRYIVFTAFVLILLLIFQIYWVIGNQLTTQLAELLQKGTDAGVQISENQKEHSTIEILYRQNESESFKTTGTYTFYSSPEWERDILDNLTERARLEADLELLKTQQDRSFTILSVWSRPWDWLIATENLSGEDKYTPQFESIDAQTQAINEQISDDPDGTKAADVLNSTFSPQLNVIDDQLRDLYAQSDEKNLQEAELQNKIEAINSQLTDLSGDDSARALRKNDLEAQANELNEQLADLEAREAVNKDQATGISDQLRTLASDPAADPSRIAALQSQLQELDQQLSELETAKADIQKEIEEIQNQLIALVGDENARQSREAALNSQLSDLNVQLSDLEASKTVIGDQIQSLQAQSNGLISLLVSPQQIVNQRKLDLEQLSDQKNALERQKVADANREKSRQAQLASTFVLEIMQGYLLPLLYGLLGASTYVLRTLSRQIADVTYTEEAGIQHLSRIALGALAGIMVGWFSFLIDTTTFLGSVSPLAIAFLVGYNIEVFFSLMDVAINRIKKPEEESSEAQPEGGTDASAPPPPQEAPPPEGTVTGAPVG